MSLEDKLGFTPFFELAIRKIWYSENKLIRNMKSKVQDKEKKQSGIANQDCKNEIFSAIRNLNISAGDILIVHSSAEQLSNVGIDAKELFVFLREIVGEEGTIVIPAFPLYTDKAKDSDGNSIYNPRKTLCSTGLIPNLFLRQPGVQRSLFPWNTLAAQGPKAEEMMEHNLEVDLAHGKGSAWAYCYENHAKILLLGVKSSHTTTMVHVAEDILDEKWPIEDWYENRIIHLQTKNEDKLTTIRIRKQYWARYNASWYRSYCLKKNNILYETQINGFNVGFINDSGVLVDYIIDRTVAHHPFFVVPKGCYKNEK